MNIWIDRHKFRQLDGYIDRKIDVLIDKQKLRKIDRQITRQMNIKNLQIDKKSKPE